MMQKIGHPVHLVPDAIFRSIFPFLTVKVRRGWGRSQLESEDHFVSVSTVGQITDGHRIQTNARKSMEGGVNFQIKQTHLFSIRKSSKPKNKLRFYCELPF